MRNRISSHLTFANVASLTAVFIALGGTAAGAVIITDNSQVGPDTISGHKPRVGNQPNIIGGTVNGTDIATAGVVGRNLDSNSVNGSKVTDGSLTGADVKVGSLTGGEVNDGSLTGVDINDGSLTGADIADQSGVDTCQEPLVAKYGAVCVGTNGSRKVWRDAAYYCSGYGLRLPTLSEALTLADNYDVPGVAANGTDRFWTDDLYYGRNATLNAGEVYRAVAVTEDGRTFTDFVADAGNGALNKVVCVTDPSA